MVWRRPPKDEDDEDDDDDDDDDEAVEADEEEAALLLRPEWASNVSILMSGEGKQAWLSYVRRASRRCMVGWTLEEARRGACIQVLSV